MRRSSGWSAARADAPPRGVGRHTSPGLRTSRIVVAVVQRDGGMVGRRREVAVIWQGVRVGVAQKLGGRFGREAAGAVDVVSERDDFALIRCSAEAECEELRDVKVDRCGACRRGEGERHRGNQCGDAK